MLQGALLARPIPKWLLLRLIAYGERRKDESNLRARCGGDYLSCFCAVFSGIPTRDGDEVLNDSKDCVGADGPPNSVIAFVSTYGLEQRSEHLLRGFYFHPKRTRGRSRFFLIGTPRDHGIHGTQFGILIS